MVDGLLCRNDELHKKLLKTKARAQHFEEQWHALTTTTKMEDKAFETEELVVSEVVEEMLMKDKWPLRAKRGRKRGSRRPLIRPDPAAKK